MALKLYTTSLCDVEVGSSIPLSAYDDHSEGAQDLSFFAADVEADPSDTGNYEVVTESDPGVDNIVLTPADGDPGGGQSVSELRLATTAVGLDSATAGAALSLGSTITAGVSGAVEVHARFENARTTIGIASDLSIEHNALITRVKP